MVDIRTIKAKECCCGCTLRTGSMILLWISLVVNCLATLYHLSDVVYTNKSRTYYYANPPSFTQLTIRSVYYLVWSIAGLISSLLGLFGIQKNVPQHLTFSLYYLGYYVFYFLMCMFVVTFFNKTFVSYIFGTNSIIYETSRSGEFILVAIVGYLFAIALTLYFMLIIRSCRDSMMKNSTAGKGSEIPDPAAYGYNASY